MPYLPTAQSWLENSHLLLSARPTTARITTKYTILRTPAPTATPNPAHAPPSHQQQQHRDPPKAVLVLKTYDPVSGVCLKYRTDKAAEVGRLVAALGSCGRVMAGLGVEERGKGGVEGGEEGKEEEEKERGEGKKGKEEEKEKEKEKEGKGKGGGGKKRKGKR